MGKILAFYEIGSIIVAETTMFDNVGDEPGFFSLTRQSKTFRDIGDIIDVCVWYDDSPGIMKVAIPPLVLVRSI